MLTHGPRIPCPVCGRTIGTYVPASHPGMVQMIKHKNLTTEELTKRQRVNRARCPGSFKLVTLEK